MNKLRETIDKLRSGFYLSFFIVFFLGWSYSFLFSQNYVDKSHYLVDGLNLKDLSDADKEIIELSLKSFHSAKTEMQKIESLTDICENLTNDIWFKYQLFQKELIVNELKKNNSVKDNKKLEILLANSYMNIGYYYDFHGDISNGLHFYFRSLKIAEKINDDKIKAALYNNIGYVYNNQGYRDTGLDYYIKSLKILDKIGDSAGLAEMNNNIGFIYYHKSNMGKAIDYFNKSLSISKSLKDDKGMATALINLGYIQNIQGNTNKSLELYEESLKLYQAIGNELGIAQTYNNLGSLMYKLGKVSQAKEYGLKGFELAKKHGIPDDISTTASLLSRIYAKEGNHQKAYEMLLLNNKMNDSINNIETLKSTANQKAKYEYEKKKAIDDKEHEKQIAVAHEAKEKQQVIIFSTFLGLLLLAGFLFFFVNRLRVTRKQKNTIEDQKAILEIRNKEIQDSINYSKRIQDAILPSSNQLKSYLRNGFVYFNPKAVVSGDFYWLEKVGDAIYFAVADCTGHGVPGAMVSVVCSNALSKALLEDKIQETGKLLDRTRELVIQSFSGNDSDVKDGMDISLCKLEGFNLQWSGANNSLWILKNKSGEILEIKADKQPIGKTDHAKSFTSHNIQLDKNDTIYLFSDGFADQFGGEKGKKYMYKPLKNLLEKVATKNMDEQNEILSTEFNRWKGSLEQVDDVCIIGVRI